MDLQAALAIVVPMGGAVVVWLLRLEGRINTNEAVAKLALEKMADDVAYIRERVDRALNGKGGHA